MFNKDTQGTYSFSYTDADGRNIVYTVDVTDDNELLFWPEVHTHFVNFLSSVFGYDIRDKISVKDVRDLTDLDSLFENYGGSDDE